MAQLAARSLRIPTVLARKAYSSPAVVTQRSGECKLPDFSHRIYTQMAAKPTGRVAPAEVL